MLELIGSVQPFTYNQEGEVHLGYYDPGTRLFVALVDDIVVTVFHTRPSYVEGLKRRLP